jgi:hypothetical protein
MMRPIGYSPTMERSAPSVIEEVRRYDEGTMMKRHPSRVYALLRIISTAGAVLLSQPKPRTQ